MCQPSSASGEGPQTRGAVKQGCRPVPALGWATSLASRWPWNKSRKLGFLYILGHEMKGHVPITAKPSLCPLSATEVFLTCLWMARDWPARWAQPW